MLRERLRVSVAPRVMDEVRVFVVTPVDIPLENCERVLMHVHGGCYALNPGEAMPLETIVLAGFGRFQVVAVDYRMPPDAYFLAALDDTVTVWKTLLRAHDLRKMGSFGAWASGERTLETGLRAKLENFALSAAIAPGTPMSNITGMGASFQINALVNNVFVSPDGLCDAGAAFYADGHNLWDPLLSPINGDFAGFPPALLTTGMRNLLLSDTVRTYRPLRQADIEAVLQTFEGHSHANYYRDDIALEVRELSVGITVSFDRHLAR